MEAPYGTWSSPIDGATVARDRGWMYSLVTAAGPDVYWSEARPLEGGRYAIVVPPRRRRARRRDPRTLQRSHPRARVRRRRVHRARRRAVLLQRRRPARVPRRGADHARARDAVRPALRRPASARRPRDRRPRAGGRARARQRAGRLRSRRLAGARRARLRPRLLRRAAGLARRDAARVPDLGPPADAVGGLGAVGDGARRRSAAQGRGRPGGGDRPAGMEPGRRPALQLGPHGLVEPLPRRLRARDRTGGRDRRAAVGLRRVLVRVPARRPDRLHRLQRGPRPAWRWSRTTCAVRAGRRHPRSSTSPPTARGRCSSAPPPRARRPCSPRTSRPANSSG